jgi:5,10-methylenetetrahydromethanopterin reductase
VSSAASTSIGVTFRPEWPPGQLPEFASEVERLGYDELWVVEDCFFAGGLTLAATALAATSRIRVGVGLLPTAVRNPAIAAMELATLANVHPGRLDVAFGHGVESWMRQIGARPRNRLVVLEETIGVVAELLAGRSVSIDGEFVSLNDVALDHPPTTPPRLLVGTTGRQGLEIAGRHADGILLPQGATPDAVRWARSITTAANPGATTAVYSWVWIDDDPARAHAALRPELAGWRTKGRYPELARRAPAPDRAAVAPDAEIDAALDEMALVGDAAACAAAVHRLADAGTDSVVLRPSVADGRAHVRRFASDVLPLLAGAGA